MKGQNYLTEEPQTHYTNTEENNIQNIQIQDTRVGLMPVNPILHYQIATTQATEQ